MTSSAMEVKMNRPELIIGKINPDATAPMPTPNVTSRPANIQPKLLDINSESVPKGLSAYEIFE